MLKDSGIDFDKLAKDGCEHLAFAELIIASGIVLNEEIRWICFHGSYDFAYFLKLIIN
jgi:CCR4-NOT transcription complex subunit 7/8